MYDTNGCSVYRGIFTKTVKGKIALQFSAGLDMKSVYLGFG